MPTTLPQTGFIPYNLAGCTGSPCLRRGFTFRYCCCGSAIRTKFDCPRLATQAGVGRICKRGQRLRGFSRPRRIAGQETDKGQSYTHKFVRHEIPPADFAAPARSLLLGTALAPLGNAARRRVPVRRTNRRHDRPRIAPAGPIPRRAPRLQRPHRPHGRRSDRADPRRQPRNARSLSPRHCPRSYPHRRFGLRRSLRRHPATPAYAAARGLRPPGDRPGDDTRLRPHRGCPAFYLSRHDARRRPHVDRPRSAETPDRPFSLPQHQ